MLQCALIKGYVKLSAYDQNVKTKLFSNENFYFIGCFSVDKLS